MSRLLLKLSLLVTFILTLTNLTARIFGSTQPYNSAMRGFSEGCQDQPQPCWYGIIPDKTSFDDAVHLIRDHDLPVNKSPNETDFPAAIIKADFMDCEVELFRSDKDASLFGGFYFQNCQTLKLGDILNQMGTPYTVGTTFSCDFNPSQHLMPMSHYWMQYPPIGSVSLNAKPDFWTWLSLNDSVVSFDFGRSLGEYPPPKKWEGFIPFWRYIQLHVDQVQTSSCGP